MCFPFSVETGPFSLESRTEEGVRKDIYTRRNQKINVTKGPPSDPLSQHICGSESLETSSQGARASLDLPGLSQDNKNKDPSPCVGPCCPSTTRSLQSEGTNWATPFRTLALMLGDSVQWLQGTENTMVTSRQRTDWEGVMSFQRRA